MGCEHCGRPLDEHQRDVQFRLPDAVLRLPDQERTEGTWLAADDVGIAAAMQVPRIGSYIRALLPVRLTGGYEVTFGVWIEVTEDDVAEISETWSQPAYAELVIDGHLANDLPVWGLVGAPVRATVVDLDMKPVITASNDLMVHAVITDEWPHEDLLAALPPL